MCDELKDYFYPEDEIKILSEEIKQLRLTKNSLVDQIKDLDASIMSISESERTIVYNKISDLTRSVDDFERIIRLKKKELDSLLTPTFTSNSLTLY